MTAEEALWGMRGRARGHADYMGDQAYYPDEDDWALERLDAIEAELKALRMTPERAAFVAAAEAIGDDIGELVSSGGDKTFLAGTEITKPLAGRLGVFYDAYRAMKEKEEKR